MATLRDKIKDVVRDTLSTGASSKYRLATIDTINNDGTATAQLDGASLPVSPMYPVVTGQSVVLVFSDGAVHAIPTRAHPAPIPFEHPPFFTGGFVRFSGLSAFSDGIQIQDAFSPNLYEIDISDLPGYFPVGVGSPTGLGSYSDPVGGVFSPDGTRIVVVLLNTTLSLARVRVYHIGPTLTSAGVIDSINKIFTLKTTLLIDVTRPSNNLGLSGFTGNVWIGRVALTADATLVYWSEVEFLSPSVNGAPVNHVHLYKAGADGIPVEITPPLTTKFLYPVPTFVNARSFFNVGLGSLRPLTTTNNLYQEWLFAGELWDPERGQWLAAIDSFQDGFGTLASQTGDTPFPHDDPNNPTEGPASVAIIVPTGKPYNFSGWGGILTSGTVPDGGMSIVKQSSGQFAPYFNSFATQVFGGVGKLSISRNLRSVLFRNIASPTVKNDFLSIFRSDISTGEISEVKLTNSLAADSSLGFGAFSPSFNPLLLLSSLNSGFILDTFTHLRKVTSTDAGLTYTADPITDALQISPGQPDPTIIRPSGLIRAVSTL